MDYAKRIDKFFDFILQELVRERKALVNNKAYIDNREYFDRLKINPLIASAKLMKELAEKANVKLSQNSNFKYQQILKFRR